jgi:hypothetical protein
MFGAEVEARHRPPHLATLRFSHISINRKSATIAAWAVNIEYQTFVDWCVWLPAVNIVARFDRLHGGEGQE